MKKHLQKLLLLVAFLLPWATQAQDSCQFKIVGEDAYADGWNGGVLSIVQNGTTVATFNASNADNDGMGPELDSTFVLLDANSPVSFTWTSGMYDDEVTIWIYNASGVLLFTVTQPTAGTIFSMGSPCSDCFAPGNPHVDSITSDFARLVWNGSAASYGILWGASADMAIGSGTPATANDTYYEFSDLTSGTAYTVQVWTICDNNETSDTVTYTFVTLGDAVSTFPYTTGFEAGEDTAWTFVNDGTNLWFIGPGAAQGGTNGMYISNNNGTSNEYTNSSAQFSYAYRVMNISESGQYAVSFDWKAYGESSYDYLRAWIAPATATSTLTAGHDPQGGSSAYNYTTTTPPGWIDLGGKMNLQSSWQTKIATPSIDAGSYILVFMWANDGSGGSNPPAAIDNIEFTQLTCPQPTNLTISNVATYTVDLTWRSGGEETEWEIFVSDTVSVMAYDTAFTVTDLEPYTQYHFGVRAVCGVDDTSFITTTGTVRTLPSCPQPTHLVVDSVNTSEIMIHWTAGGQESSWMVTINDSLVADANDTSYHFTDLDINTPYTIKVRALCNVDDTSFVTSVSTRTLAGEPISEFPYTCGFEITDDDVNEAADWVLENGTQVNAWYVGTASHHNGSRGLYISNNNGTSNEYTVGSTSHVYAYATFNFSEVGEYAISYDWKSQGESYYYDWLRVFLVPGDVNLTAGSSMPLGSSTYNASTAQVPAGWIDLTNRTVSPYTLSQSSSWNTVNTTFTITNTGLYKLVFMWSNDASGGSQPPASVDNIMVDQLTCPSPVNFVIDSISPFEATLTWSPVGSETMWGVRAVSAAGTDEWQTASDTSYTYSGLASGTSYTFQLVAICDVDDTSLIVSCSGSTPVTCPTPTNFDVTTAGDTASFTWTDPNASNWELVYGPVGINPYTADDVTYLNINSYEVSGLDTGFYHAWLRTDCGGDYSSWVGPVVFGVNVLSMNMQTSGVDTVRTCAAVIYDDGGANGQYSSSCDATLVILPSTPGSEVVISGSSYTESTFDYIRIYAGVGTSGEQLWNDYGVSAQQTFGPFSADAITVVFHSDGSVTYDGFEINVGCSAPASCPRPTALTCNPGSADSVVLSWTETGEANSWQVVVGTPGFIPDTVDSPIDVYDNNYVFTTLQGGVTYEVYVRSNCGNEYSNWSGPLSVTPGQFIIGTSGAATISMCGGAIYDDGGPNGQYSNNVNYTLTVYPAHPDSMLTFHGTAYTESSIDYLRIYEGAGTGGTLLWQTSTSSQQDVIPLDTCISGPITLHFYTDGSVVYNGFELFINCVSAPECSPVDNLSAKTTPTAALVSWQPGFYGNYSGANVEYKADTVETWASLPPVSGNYAIITGLDAGTLYNVRVTTDCDGYPGGVAMANFTTKNYPCLEADSASTASGVIGTGNTQTSGVPVNSAWGNTMCQSIYLASELNDLGISSNITNISYTWTSNSSYNKDFSIYMTNTTATEFSGTSASDWQPTGAATLVYQGPHPVGTSGTVTYQLDTPFIWDGSSNICITTTMNQPAGASHSSSGFYGLSTSTSPQVYRTMYKYQDSSPIDGSNPSSVAPSSRSYYRPNITIGSFGCSQYGTCAAPAVAVIEETTSSVTLAWAPGANETSWNLYYRLVGASTWESPVVVTNNEYTITGLNSGSNYEFMVENACTEGDFASIVEATTLCAPVTLPYTENFNSWATGSLPNCWYNTGAYSTTNYSIISGSQNMSGAHGGSVYMYSSSGATYISRIILPELDSTYQVNQTQLVFNVKTTSSSYMPSFIVGVMDNPYDLSTLVPVDTIQPFDAYNRWEVVEASLANYTGTGAHVVIQTLYLSNYFYCYIDDVTLELIPSCPRPDSLMASNATTSSVDLSWHERGSATQWIIEYGPRGFQLGTGTPVLANSNPFTLTGIPSSYQGDFYVKSVCGYGDTGDYSRRPAAFSTTQIPATLPYNYDFEDPTEWANWQTCSNHNNNWFRGTAVADSSMYSIYISADGGTTYKPYLHDAVVNATAFRDIDFGPVDSSYTFSFRARAGGTTTGGYDGMIVLLADPSIPTVPSDQNLMTPWGDVRNLYQIIDVRTDTTWQTYSCSFDTIHGVQRVAFYWFNQNTQGSSSYPNLGEPVAMDNLHIDYSSCPRPLNVETIATTSSTATLTWTGASNANYEVVYRQVGGTNSVATTNTNQITLTGLASAATYYAWVRKVCSATDASLYSDRCTFETEMCDGAVVVATGDPDLTSTTSYNAPVNNFYNYTLSEMIIDSAEIGGPMEFTTIAYYYDYSSASTDKTNVTIWLQPTNKTTFSSSTDVVALDTANAVMVYSGNLNCSQGWNYFAFSTNYTYNGNGNLMVIVDDNSGAYDGSSYVFRTASCNGTKTLTQYSDSYHPNVLSPSGFSGSSTSYQWRPLMQLISCGFTPTCNAPVLTGVNTTYQSATVTWSGSGNAYEVACKAVAAPTWPAEAAVSGNTYTFNGLQPATEYTYRVRQDCDTLGYSDWVTGTFTTDSLPCLAPTGLAVSDITNHEATFSWTPVGTETAWELHVWTSGGLDTMVTSQTTTRTVDGFVSNVTYNAQVRALCGTDQSIEGQWSNSIQFTTVACPTVTGLQTTNVLPTSISVSWNSVQMAQGYELEYGVAGTAPGSGTIVQVSATSYTITGLEPMQMYDIRVMALCGDNWYSEEAATLTGVQTPDIPDDSYVLTVTSNNPAWGTVTLNPAGGVYPAGTQVTLTATPTDASLYSFVNWSDNVTDNPRVITVNSDITLQAIFAESVSIETIDGVSFVLYPNPAKNSTTVSILGMSGKVRIAVLDVNGREVLGETVECSADCEKLMDIDGLSQGAYFVRVTGEQGTIVRKLMVK